MGAALTHPGNGPTGKQNVDLARRQAVPHPDATFASAVMSVSEFPLLPWTTQPGVQAVKPQDRSLLEAFQVARLDELQRQDAVVHEVLAMNTRNALGQHDTGAEIAHGQGGMLTARSLPVVAPADNRVTVSVALACAINVGFVDRFEGDRRHTGYAAIERQAGDAGRDDPIGRHVVAELEQYG